MRELHIEVECRSGGLYIHSRQDGIPLLSLAQLLFLEDNVD